MKNIKLLIGFVLMTVFVGCSPRFSFIKADYDGQRRPTQVGYGSSGFGHSRYMVTGVTGRDIKPRKDRILQ
jgi:hypothetical protein